MVDDDGTLRARARARAGFTDKEYTSHKSFLIRFELLRGLGRRNRRVAPYTRAN